jgi:hypothetical protein
VKAVLAALLLAAAGAGAEAPPVGSFERSIQARPGKVTLALDRDVYERARADLGDLRVLDDQGQQVPYLLERMWPAVEAGPRQPRVLNRAFVRGESSSVTLDFGEPVLKSELVLALGGDNFRRRVSVEGRNRQDERWETLTDGAYVFAVPPPAAARYESVSLPENDFPLLKVTVYNGPDDRQPVEIGPVSARPLQRRRPLEREVRLPLRPLEDAQSHETRVVADLGARHQPFRALVLEVGDTQFFRGVLLEAREEAPVGPEQEPLWRALGEGTIYRYDEGGERRERLRLDVAGRERMLRLRIRNRDDRALDLRGLSVVTPVERLVFEARAGRRYRLVYGDERIAAPVYDIARTVADPALWIAQATEGRLSQAARVVRAAPLPPWTERHPGLVWGALTGLVALLGGITWRALRAAR